MFICLARVRSVSAPFDSQKRRQPLYPPGRPFFPPQSRQHPLSRPLFLCGKQPISPRRPSEISSASRVLPVLSRCRQHKKRGPTHFALLKAKPTGCIASWSSSIYGKPPPGWLLHGAIQRESISPSPPTERFPPGYPPPLQR